MEVHVAQGQAPVLVEPDDLRRFRVVAAASPDQLPGLATELGGVVDFSGPDHAWVAVDWLLRAAGRDGSAEWRAGFDAMQAYAARQGWTREDPPALRGHVVWLGG
ncbi:hypothetical protein GXW71_11940 [Roseomonas hellenica]|uniref:Uncharacterized protein n=1 Tax=Plastoroseomonas hellenica TaxID=2687306 RepID=A0ABS5EXN8_9PROT|nr:hypothetical protein [Plastoroseomonas hellenica]MBR0665065.1 hypothetical protein [Plastoroseomonas hellenica]